MIRTPRTTGFLGRRPIFAVDLLFAALLLFAMASGACAAEPAPESSPLPLRELADGLWVGPSAGGESVFRLSFEEGRLTGRGFLVIDGKAVTEIPLLSIGVGVAERGGSEPPADPRATVELRLKTGWTYRGLLSDDATKMQGELDLGGDQRQPLDLRRVPLDAVPAIRARPPAAAGQPPYAYRRPAETGDGWTTAEAGAVGLDAARIEALVDDIVAGKAGLLHSLLLVRNGSLVVEEYFHGFGADDLHAIHSCTKSVASLLVGIAIQRGELASVDTPLLDLFPEEREAAAPGWEKLLIRHLLTMTSGARPPEGRHLPAGPELLRAVLARPPATPVGERWRYSDLDADLLAAVLQRATGVQADDYAGRHLFAPLGVESWDWEQGRLDGYPRLYGTLRLRPRDLAKIGAMMLAGGRWDGRQVVAKDWVRDSTREQVRADDDGYGFLWWREPAPPSLPAGVFSARGIGSQFLFVSPDRSLAVVVTGGNSLNDMGGRIGELLGRHLAPAAATAQSP